MRRHWWFSTKRMTFDCITDEENIVIDIAPIGSWSKGHHVKRLVYWLRKQGGFRYHEYKNKGRPD